MIDEALVLDEKAFSVSDGWTIVKVRAHKEREIYDLLFKGQPDYYEASEAEFLSMLGVNIPNTVRTIRFGKAAQTDVVFYGFKDA